jgi:hypothetical protein
MDDGVDQTTLVMYIASATARWAGYERACRRELARLLSQTKLSRSRTFPARDHGFDAGICAYISPVLGCGPQA